MKYLGKIILGVAILGAMAGMVNAESMPLSAGELKTLLDGNSMVGNGKTRDPGEPYDWAAFYDTSGEITMKLKPEWGGIMDTGKWWITDKGELCRQFKKMASGKEGCWLFYKEGAFYRFVPSSGLAVEGRTAILKGNYIEKMK